MADNTGSGGSGPNVMIIAVVALLIIAGLAIWFTTRDQPTEKPGTTISGSATVEDKDADVSLKVNLPDSVTIDAR